MSIHGTCFDEGSSGRCNIHDCPKFFDGDCPSPEEIMSYEELISEEFLKDIYELYPELFIEQNKIKKEIELMIDSKLRNKMATQHVERKESAELLAKELTGFTVRSVDDFFDDEKIELLHEEVVNIPVKLSCYANSGDVRVFIGGAQALQETLAILMSDELIKYVQDLKNIVKKSNAQLGCGDFKNKVKAIN